MDVESNQNYPTYLPYYKVLLEAIDEKVDPDFMKTQDNVPSEDQANNLALAYLASKGGLPGDAVLNKVEQQKLQKIDYTNGQVVEEYALGVDVIYTRELNGLKVVGPGDFIYVSLGENGKVLCYQKSWRALRLQGDIDLIPVNDAVTKLRHEDYREMSLGQYQSPVTITEITAGYYANNKGELQDYYYPIWIFSGTDSVGTLVQISIDATN